jgi:hypothetical protein
LKNKNMILFFSWGIRQESSFTIGDWKHSKVENPLWHKMALTWPVDGTGAMIPVRTIIYSIEIYFSSLGFTMAVGRLPHSGCTTD